jgi:hypothetical protein
MPNYLAQNREALEKRHYIVKAGVDDYWFNFARRKLQTYIGHFEDRFCMVVNHSDAVDDAYIMPYGEVKTLFTEKNLRPDGSLTVTCPKQREPHSSGEQPLQIPDSFKVLFGG